MRRPEHDIDHLGMLLENRGQGFNHLLDSLVRGQQAEGQEDGLSLDTELILVKVRVMNGMSMTPCGMRSIFSGATS